MFFLFGQIISLIILIIFNLISTLILSKERSYKVYKFLLKMIVDGPIINHKIEIIGDNKLLNKKGVIIIANHQNAQDFAFINNLFTNVNVICKYNLFKDDDLPIYLKIFSKLNLLLFKAFRFIPYKRGDKDSGDKVKNIILDKINSGENILVFPEGEPTRDGIPKKFKSGLFRTAFENNIPIIPITFKYKKPVGVNREDKINPLKWFNNEVTITIHKIQNINNENSWKELKQNCFNLIRKPMLDKIE